MKRKGFLEYYLEALNGKDIYAIYAEQRRNAYDLSDAKNEREQLINEVTDRVLARLSQMNITIDDEPIKKLIDQIINLGG